MDDIWDCVIAGGGAAGLSAALVLGRARRRTLLVDAGAPSNAVSHGIGGLLGQDGRPPAELYATGRRELERYPTVEVRTGEVVDAERGELFTVRLADGGAATARRLLLATGMDYRLPDVPGLADLWGDTVFHCPFCHGWEMRDAPLAAMASGGRAVHAALMLRGWSDDIVLLTDSLTEDEFALVSAAGIAVDTRAVAEVRGVPNGVEIVFSDGAVLARGGLMAAPVMRQRSALAERLGVRLNSGNPMAEDAVWVDEFGRTSVAGVFAAGDVTVQMPQVAAAIAAGAKAAAATVQSLLADDYGLPVPA
ncbi:MULTISPECIES: NAD(P)/FAD-dependent oxidoreductase [Mycobacteriaceae]|uniref:NAD(P)/FAD-dependent oxidoreductase n=1 Tax=Mycobacteriaceae TaxID=1762 RepID=UPI0007FE63E6|nr:MULTISPECIES: NAD(P)/FAD-dependent oxidoreductase [Mycobacteriaceae]MCK0173438.1 NAD(P)/FAD-dependent oxidoreductase [Mycolicibacterium sp. F2034L]OBB59422.1 pyridine nucleotide-disulfide oxidoreductase [Mycobacterium sp. 852013-51886_SCH5428379]